MIPDGRHVSAPYHLVPASPPAGTGGLRAGGRPGSSAVVVTGSYGAGHDSAAHEIRTRLEAVGWRVGVLDVADLYLFGLGHLLRRAYFKQLQVAPSSWGMLLSSLDDHGRPSGEAGRRAGAIIGRLTARRMAAAITGAPDLVISTHPFASQALGQMRERGRLGVPVVTYLTDPSVHPLWVHRAVDVHVAVYDEAARQARLRGADDVRVIRPLTPLVDRRTGEERDTFRAHLGLAPDQPIALLSGGSEGVGAIRAAARDVRDTGAATPVVLCAHNDKLRRRLEREAGVVPIGWLDGLTSAIRASDCVIQNSGGFTSLEALALGVPLVSYRCLPGHGASSAQALELEGLASWPQSVPDLGAAISAAVAQGTTWPPGKWLDRPTLLDVLPTPAPVELVG